MNIDTPDLASYDRVLVAFSGGKDSLWCLLHLLDCGVPFDKIELWHHEIDGREGSTLMDWPVTPAYCRAVAAHFGVPIHFSWKVGGFEREMLRDRAATAPTMFEMPGGLDGHGREVRESGGRGPAGTRLKYPQVSPDLSVRWCSAYLKIDVMSSAIRNQARFDHARTLVVTGERGEESAARAKYKTFEPHRVDARDGRNRRHVDHWRPARDVLETEVWDRIRAAKIAAHPAYVLGWGRVSCMRCIFGSPDQWASSRVVDPAGFAKVAAYEARFGVTIQRKLSVIQLADKGRAYTMLHEDVEAAMSREYRGPIVQDPWRMPAGAFGDSCGPT